MYRIESREIYAWEHLDNIKKRLLKRTYFKIINSLGEYINNINVITVVESEI